MHGLCKSIDCSLIYYVDANDDSRRANPLIYPYIFSIRSPMKVLVVCITLSGGSHRESMFRCDWYDVEGCCVSE